LEVAKGRNKENQGVRFGSAGRVSQVGAFSSRFSSR